MSQTYLDKFRSTLPTTQGNQILKLLISKRDSGEIRTVDEFKARLQELTSQLLEERITPTLKLFMAKGGEDTSSDQFNEMMDRIQDDLEAAFAEADNIDEIIDAHHNIINRITLKALRFGVNELDSKISLYEFLSKSKKGFDSALFNTFRESKNLSTARSDNAASLVYIDPRRAEVIPSEEDATVDIIGERLILGSDTFQYLPIKEAVWLSNSSSIRSELDVQFPNSSLRNIIDGRNNTYWIVPILLSQVRSDGVPLEICLGLNASQDVNFVEIEPAVEFPIDLIGIDYFDSNNIRRAFSSSSVTLNGPTRINFGRITTNCLVLRFKQYNYKEIQFRRKPGESNFHKAILRSKNDPVNLDSISEDLREVLSSDFILSDIMGLTTSSGISEKFFEYILGFDNIRVGFNTFNERSIFVSSKKEVIQPGQVALRVREIRPQQISGSTSITLEEHTYPERSTSEDEKFYHGSVEYWLTIQLYGDDNFLISTDTIPILPIGAKRIYHEQLVFTAKSGTGVQNNDLASLMFFTDDDETDVQVYRNNTLLTYGNTAEADWEFVGPGENIDNSNITLTTPNAKSRMKRGIRIWRNVHPLDIYTVSYTPKISNTHVIPSDTTLLNIVDLIGDRSVRMGPENVILFNKTRNSQNIAKADIYLSIIMRRNSANLNFSPAVEEYILVTGSNDQTKFVSD